VEEVDSEVYECIINGIVYYTTNETNGVIYATDESGEIGDEVGEFKNGIACIK
jgi:hypothetical protein